MPAIETSPPVADIIDDALSKCGMQIRGVLSQSDLNELDCDIDAQTLVLIGNVGSAMWAPFVRSCEFADGEADPMDRWSRRTGEQLAARLSDNGIRTQVLFPFDGPPYVPFQRLAGKADVVQPSALGILIHPRYGLWQAYRFALALDVDIQAPVKRADAEGICDSCTSKPCLNICPVDAFQEGHYDVDACVNYLADTPDATCLTNGCIARHACPEGASHHYTRAHAQFHMRAFLVARNPNGSEK